MSNPFLPFLLYFPFILRLFKLFPPVNSAEEVEDLMAPYWLPRAVANGFDIDNMVVFETQGGGEYVKE